MNSPYVSLINDKVCYLQNPIHENIKYSDLPKTQTRNVIRASDVMKDQLKLLDNRTWNLVIIEYFLKDEAMKEVVPEMDILTTLSRGEIIRQNQCQTRYQDKFLLKQNETKNDDN